jgi:hypothetical protein
MASETFWVIAVAVVLILAPLYGYWIGTVGKRRSWSAGRLGQVLLITLLIAVFGGWQLVDSHQVSKWVRVAVFAAVYSYILLTAFFAAAKSSGIPIRKLLSSRGDLGTELKGKSDLSIR